MAAIYSNGGNRWNILGFNFTKRDALSSVYKISMVPFPFLTFQINLKLVMTVISNKQTLFLVYLSSARVPPISWGGGGHLMPDNKWVAFHNVTSYIT